MALTISRAQYVATYGPTVGDKVRLGDTNLWATIEQDFLTKGDECKFGGGKSVRDGMAQSGTATRDNPNVLDFVITNVMIIDAKLGIIKADIGIRDGRIVGIGNDAVIDRCGKEDESKFTALRHNYRAVERIGVTAFGEAGDEIDTGRFHCHQGDNAG